MMTKEQAMNKAIELKNERFYLAMKDMWNNWDFDEDRRLKNEIDKLIKEYDLDLDNRVGY